MRWEWLVAPLPAALGLAVAVLTASEQLANPIIYLRGDLGTLAVLAGLLLSAVMSSYLLFGARTEKDCQRRVAEIRTQAIEERWRFLRRLDHELKNPLTAVRAGLVNLAEAPTEVMRREALSSVETQIIRLSRLAADLRKLAELETRRLERAPVDLAGLLQEVLALARERPEAKGRRLTLTLPQAPWPLPRVMGDWDLLFLVMHNLVDNALKFTRPGDTVEIRAFEDGATVVLEVADTGLGVPESEGPHVWEELYRGQGARGVPGSGLGLALVRAIVERHGGQAVLRSRVGQGTVVTVRLPVR
jgi:two-component system OmpR family sensor kinase